MNSSREIKFRAWDDKKGMIHLTELHLPCPGYLIEQFTGLHDKNGREIFEGDILRLGGAVNGYVTFGFGCFIWNEINGEIRRTFDQVHSRLNQVIGNIHENPDLLEVS